MIAYATLLMSTGTCLYAVRKLVDNSVGLQGNMDPRIFYYEFNTIKKYLNSLNEFGSKNSNFRDFQLGHGFLPDIDHLKVKKPFSGLKKTIGIDED